MSHHWIEAKDLHYAYPDGTVALAGVAFSVTHGESVALVGGNGAGKSTLLAALSGCLVPTQGSLQVGDDFVTRATLGKIRKTVGMVFQNPDDQLFMPTVYEDVAFGPLNLGLAPAEVDARTLDALQRVGAAHLRERPPYRLSAGEKRAAAVAAVLSLEPSILVMDEPTSNLDPKARRRLIELLATFEHTKMIATHDLDLVLDLCERTIVLREGRTVADGPTPQIMGDPALLAQSNLEPPLRMQACPVCADRSDSAGGKRAS